MMRWTSFGRSVLFALSAAAAAPAAWLLLLPLAGGRATFALVWIGAVSLYAAGIAPRAGSGRGIGRRGLAAGALVALPGALFASFYASPFQVATGAALALAIARGAFLYPARPARALALELALGLGGLAFAHFLGAGLPGPLGAALALWGYLLVQSTFFLVGGGREPARDPFDDARDRLLALLRD